jgi:hypothetical protein
MRPIHHWDGHRLWAEWGEYDRSPERQWARTYVVSSDWDGSSIDTLLSYSSSPMMPQGAGMAQAMMDDPPMDLSLLSGSGHFFYSRLEEDWIRKYELPGGREILRFRWMHEPDSVPESLIEELAQFVPAGNRDEIADGVQWLRERATAFDLGEGPDGEIWVQRTAWTGGAMPYAVDVFSSEGRYRGRLEVPFTVRLMQYRERNLYAIGQVGEAPALIRYRLREAR